jgi:hypothetical protein
MLRSIGLAVAVALLASCGSDDPAPIVADEFVLPLVKASRDGALSVSLIEASLSPPARGNNTWTLEVSDADGNPVEALDFSVVLYMPAHKHGSSPTTVTEGTVAGEYSVSRINFTMSGVWEVRLISAGELADRDVVFYVDVAD